MVEFYGTRITEQELEQIYDIAMLGVGRCQALLEFASSVEDRVFAVAAQEAFMALLKKCCRSSVG